MQITNYSSHSQILHLFSPLQKSYKFKIPTRHKHISPFYCSSNIIYAFLVGDRSASIVPSSSLLSSSNPLSSSFALLFSPRRIRPTAPSLASAGLVVIGLFNYSEKLTFGPLDTPVSGTPAARSGVGRYGLD